MNVTLIEEPEKQAKEKLRQYRSALQTTTNKEYQQAARAYRELAKGKALINIVDALGMATLDSKGRPNLAIGAADMPEVHLSLHDGSFQFKTGDWNQRARRFDIIVRNPDAKWQAKSNGYALVPLIPPDCLPKIALSNFCVLWEVEEWADRPQRMRPDRDPLLLRQIAGDLYSVEAAWDLTEVERMVMTGRRRN